MTLMIIFSALAFAAVALHITYEVRRRRREQRALDSMGVKLQAIR